VGSDIAHVHRAYHDIELTRRIGYHLNVSAPAQQLYLALSAPVVDGHAAVCIELQERAVR
jgi:hypothetical protein